MITACATRLLLEAPRRQPIAAVGIAVLLAAGAATAQTRLDDRQLIRLVSDAVADQSNQGAFRQVMQNYDRYRKLAAEGRVPAADVEVLDNQIWDRSLRAWDKVQRRFDDSLERVDLVGSGGRRLEAGSTYQVGKSDLDFIPRGEAAEAAAAEYMKAMAAELGADPHKIGVNALSPVQAERARLIEAANHPEKYSTPERLKALDYQTYRNGMTLVWENGQPQRVPVRELYARNGWAPPPEPVAIDAFGMASAEHKFLNESVRKGLSGAEKAIYEAKYHARALDHAVNVGGVELPRGSEGLQRELRAIADSKSVRDALAERIARHGGHVEAAVAEYTRDAASLQKQVTADLLRKHVTLLHDKAALGGEAAAEAQAAVRNLKHSLAIFSDAQTRELLNSAGLKPESVEVVAEKVSRFRREIAVEGERAAIEAQRVARAIVRELPAAERAAFVAQLESLTKTPGGRTLLRNIADTMRARPVASGLIAVAAVSEVQRISGVAGEKGWAEGARAAGNAAGDWYLMSLSPHYAAARLAIDLGKLGVEVAITGPVKETTAREAYEGDAGFLAHLGYTRGELTRRFATEADALREARQWYQKWMVNKGEYLGKTEVEEAFYRQVRADYETSRWLQMARDYSFDPQTRQYGEQGFFRRVGNGQITFENFAERFRYEEAARQAIDFYLEYTWYYDWEKYGGRPADREAREQMLRRYLLELWKASAKYNEQWSRTREEARRQADLARVGRTSHSELADEDLLEPPPDDDPTASIETIPAAPTVHEGIKRTWPLLRSLEQLAEEIREEVADMNRLADAASASGQSLEVYRQAVEADRAFLDQTVQQLDRLRTAIARGALQPAAAERLRAEFQAVQAEADGIAADADSARADYEAGRMSTAAVRQRYFALLSRFRLAQERFLPARDAFEQWNYLSRIRSVAQECELAQRRFVQYAESSRDLAEQLQDAADGIEDRLAALTSKVERFERLKAGLEQVLDDLQDKVDRDSPQEKGVQVLRARLDACRIPVIPAAQARAAKVAMERLADEARRLGAAKLPRKPEFAEFERWAAAAEELALRCAPDHDAAAAALERAREALERLARCIESTPIQTVRVEPPRAGNTPGSPPPGTVEGGVRIRETMRNVFVVEGANLPAGARFLWDFGDGARGETAQPQVQHNYAAPTGGLAGLAGKKWQLNVTIVVNGRAVATASYVVSRGRLNDSPINRAGPPSGSLFKPPR